MSHFKAAAIQLNSQPDLDQNLKAIHRRLGEASDSGVQLASLPENFAFFGDDREQLRLASTIAEKVDSLLPQWSKELGIWILAGGYPVPARDGKVYNRSVLFDPNGGRVATYNKIHLFDVTLSDTESYRESEIMVPGEPMPVVTEAQGLCRIGLSICYDLRFPELYRGMVDRGAELLAVPAAFTRTTGLAHWEPLLRARAIENTCWVIAPAQTGIHGKSRETHGHSMIISPWGEVVADGGREPGVITAEVNLDLLKDIRERVPSLNNRVL